MESNGNDIEQKIKLTYSTNADSVSAEVEKLDDSINDTTASQKKNDEQVKKSEAVYKSLKGSTQRGSAGTTEKYTALR